MYLYVTLFTDPYAPSCFGFGDHDSVLDHTQPRKKTEIRKQRYFQVVSCKQWTWEVKLEWVLGVTDFGVEGQVKEKWRQGVGFPTCKGEEPDQSRCWLPICPHPPLSPGATRTVVLILWVATPLGLPSRDSAYPTFTL